MTPAWPVKSRFNPPLVSPKSPLQPNVCSVPAELIVTFVSFTKVWVDPVNPLSEVMPVPEVPTQTPLIEKQPAGKLIPFEKVEVAPFPLIVVVEVLPIPSPPEPTRLSVPMVELAVLVPKA